MLEDLKKKMCVEFSDCYEERYSYGQLVKNEIILKNETIAFLLELDCKYSHQEICDTIELIYIINKVIKIHRRCFPRDEWDDIIKEGLELKVQFIDKLNFYLKLFVKIEGQKTLFSSNNFIESMMKDFDKFFNIDIEEFDFKDMILQQREEWQIRLKKEEGYLFRNRLCVDIIPFNKGHSFYDKWIKDEK